MTSVNFFESELDFRKLLHVTRISAFANKTEYEFAEYSNQYNYIINLSLSHEKQRMFKKKHLLKTTLQKKMISSSSSKKPYDDDESTITSTTISTTTTTNGGSSGCGNTTENELDAKPFISEAIGDSHQLQQFETQFVTNVYNEIAPHFSNTRYSRWPFINEFILGKKNCLFADVGCGNGMLF